MTIEELNIIAQEIEDHDLFNKYNNSLLVRRYSNGKIGLELNGLVIDDGTEEDIFHSLKTLKAFVTGIAYDDRKTDFVFSSEFLATKLTENNQYF